MKKHPREFSSIQMNTGKNNDSDFYHTKISKQALPFHIENIKPYNRSVKNSTSIAIISPNSLENDVKKKKVVSKNYTDVMKYNEMAKNKDYFLIVVDGATQVCDKGSLHGLKYITDRTKVYIERFLWSLICLSSFLVCVYIINNMWVKWRTFPFNIVVDDVYTPVYDIPFPSVTICPENTVKRSHVDLAETDDREILFSASLTCDEMTAENYSMPARMSEEEQRKILQFLIKSSPSCSDVIKSCKWMSINGYEEFSYDCCSFSFETILTDNGICFSFNTLTDISNKRFDAIARGNKTFFWTPHDGYPADMYEIDEMLPYPRRVFSAGEKFGLSLELYINSSDTQEFCDGVDFGFKMLLASPTESGLTRSYAGIPMERQTTFALVPKKVTTDSSMVSVDSETRKCYFDGEKKLKYFRFYTQFNCILECEMDYILMFCGCVPFYFRHNIKRSQTCTTFRDHACVDSVKADVNMKMIQNFYQSKTDSNTVVPNHTSIQRKKRTQRAITWCDCYPNCDEVSYNMEIFYSDLIRLNASKDSLWVLSTTKDHEVTRINIHFKEAVFFGIHRQMKSDALDFIAACGGILGVFMGFSCISLLEVVFFVAVKPIAIIVYSILKSCFNVKSKPTYLH